MSIYEELQGIATDIMKEFKQGKVDYVRMVPGSGPVDNPGPPTPVKTDLNAAARGVQFKYVQNGMAIASDLQVVSSVILTFEPKHTDFIEVDGVSHKIVQFLPKPSAGTRVAWLFIIRKGS